MAIQYFKINSAPESEGITAKQLRQLLWDTQRKTEWEVLEIQIGKHTEKDGDA